MFLTFFYHLRSYGIEVSATEWISLLRCMELGLHECTLTGFYYLCRCILSKDETDFDKFDRAFATYFKSAEADFTLSDELLEWLKNPRDDLRRSLEMLQERMGPKADSVKELVETLHKRLTEQDAEHNGGTYWIGTQGRSIFGNSGWNPATIRVGGEGKHRNAVMVAEERKYKDFREDVTIDIRRYQMALRTLRQYSAQGGSEEQEFDIDGTIRDTCDNAGQLKIHYKPPRKNAVKVILLMDSGGSIEDYSRLCNMLFQAVTKSNHFKELKVFYFHNTFYDYMYSSPSIDKKDRVSTEWILNNFGSEYKVIVVGDAMMSPDELWEPHYEWLCHDEMRPSIEWVRRIREQYPHIIWLNPEPLPHNMGYLTRTHIELANIFPMYDLSLEGLRAGIKQLLKKN